MKKLALGAGVLLLLAMILPASAVITVYAKDRPGWENAVAGYDEEFFTDATLNPGVSVVSTYPGYVDTVNGVWWDRLNCPGYEPTTTTWVFATPLTGFGGTWNPFVPGGPGANIMVSIDGSWVPVGEIPNTYENEFWGFVSTDPFTQVLLEHGSNCDGAWTETYELDNMVYSSVYRIDIDIKPGSYPNSINLKNKGNVPVAILSSPTFDAPAVVDRSSVEFACADSLDIGKTPEDVNGDGLLDMVLHFNTQKLCLTSGATKACLTGETFGGLPFKGCDSVRIIG